MGKGNKRFRNGIDIKQFQKGLQGTKEGWDKQQLQKLLELQKLLATQDPPKPRPAQKLGVLGEIQGQKIQYDQYIPVGEQRFGVPVEVEPIPVQVTVPEDLVTTYAISPSAFPPGFVFDYCNFTVERTDCRVMVQYRLAGGVGRGFFRQSTSLEQAIRDAGAMLALECKKELGRA